MSSTEIAGSNPAWRRPHPSRLGITSNRCAYEPGGTVQITFCLFNIAMENPL